MILRSDWKAILRRAWSIRLMVVAMVLTGLEAALPFVEYWLPIPYGVLSAIAALVTAGAFVARLVAQKNLSETSE